ncbi:MAG: helix-turn-helix transcriptional regulator [Bacteriovoracaceae bacterium]|nr:helix-turn-helix transcriptional regulator [Bacteriovoracaceae bacterium]
MIKNHKNNIKNILRYIFKTQEITQKDLASRLNLSAYKFNRIVNGKISLDTDIWETICTIFNINFNSISTGIITTHKQDQDELIEKLSPNRHDRFTYGKTAQIHTFLFKQMWGDEIFEEFCKHEHVDHLLFTNINNPIDFNFTLRMMQYSVLKGKLNSMGQIAQYTKSAASYREGHGENFYKYEQLYGIDKLKEMVNNLNVNYERNQRYTIDHITNKSMEISVRPNEHVNMKLYRDDPILGNFFELYLASYFHEFMKAKNLVTIKESIFKGHKRCVFQVNMT